MVNTGQRMYVTWIYSSQKEGARCLKYACFNHIGMVQVKSYKQEA